MKRNCFLASTTFLVFSTVVLANAVQLIAQKIPDAVQAKEKAKENAESDDKKKVETVTAKLKPMVVFESFDGVLEATRTQEVTTDFESWTDLKIESVIDEGTVVTSGQELLKFETESIDKAVAEAEFEAKNSQFALETAKLDMKQINATTELDQAMAEHTWKNAREDFEYYRKTELPERLKDLDFSEKSAGYFLEYAKDELDQLEQMYTEDELTEESEEIVLKRARRSVESAERNRNRTLLRLKRDRETRVPRESFQQEESLKRNEITYERAVITQPIKRQKTEIALAQAEFAYKNKQNQLQKLLGDQKKMTLSSPADGVLYYGRCVRGKWVGAQSSARRLEPGKKVPANTVAMTVVDTKHMMIRANLEESKLNSLSSGLKGKARIKAMGQTVPVRIKSVSRIPLDDGKYDCQITMEELPTEGAIMPGMNCKLSFLVHQTEQAVVVPKSSVFSDDDGVTHYVYSVVDEKQVRKEVTVGKTSGDDIEIIDGLTAGEKIAKSKP